MCALVGGEIGVGDEDADEEHKEFERKKAEKLQRVVRVLDSVFLLMILSLVVYIM